MSVAARRRHRGAGAVLAAAMLAVDDVLRGEQERHEIVEVADAPDDEPVDGVLVHLAPGAPRRSYALIRDPGW